MKKGFTMIELIFVIVILGVLAAVAIPKLNATRDDAEQAKAMTNLATLMGDLTSYYTAQGSFDKDISKMTNVPLADSTKQTPDEFTAGNFSTETSAGNAYIFNIKNKPCIAFQVDGANLHIVSAASVADNPVCKNILGNTATQNILSGEYTCSNTFQIPSEKSGTNGAWETATPDATPGCAEAANKIVEQLKIDRANETSRIDAALTDNSKAKVVSKIDAANKGIKASFEGAGVKF